MVTKNEVKYIQSLYHKKTREAERAFVVEGPKMLAELLRSSYSLKHIYATAGWINQAPSGIAVTEVSAAELQRMSHLETANQVIAVVEQKIMEKPVSFHGKITLALADIQDPGNFGTIVRIADWFGISQILATADTVEFYNPKVIQATMGSFTRVGAWYGDLEEILQNAGLPVYGAFLEGTSVKQIGRVEEGIIVIGNESRGIGESIRNCITTAVTIPRRGEAESLNAAVATGIILSHLAL
ncbi:MAG TPA: RNA methyltransferase [Chitinophagaceae bacterium]